MLHRTTIATTTPIASCTIIAIGAILARVTIVAVYAKPAARAVCNVDATITIGTVFAVPTP
jgi:hypothetical protein